MDRLSDIARGNFSRNNISAEYWLRKVATCGIQRDEIVRLLPRFYSVLQEGASAAGKSAHRRGGGTGNRKMNKNGRRGS